MLSRIFVRVQFDNKNYLLLEKKLLLSGDISSYLRPWMHVLIEQLFFPTDFEVRVVSRDRRVEYYISYLGRDRQFASPFGL